MEKKKIVIFLVVYIFPFLIGCSVNHSEISEQMENDPVFLEETVENNMSSENIIDDYSCSTKLNDYKITNLLESFAAFGIPDDFSREITVGNYSNKYPVVLQDILLYYNDDNPGEDDDWQKYEANCREVTKDDIGDSLYTELVETLNEAYAPGNVASSFHALDIDKDGDDEYVLYTVESYWNHALFILKCVDGQWVVINGGGDNRRPARILNYENNYYFLLGSRLAYWNDEAEIPGLSYWNNEDVVLGQDECWNELSLRRHVTGYTPYEIYSNAPDSSIDFLEAVDLETLTVNHAEEKDFDGVIQTYGNSAHSFRFFGGWQISYEGVNYLYATGYIYNQQDKLGESDRALFVMLENEDGSCEVVKVYYMGANYDLQFEELDPQTSVVVARK